MRTSIDFCRHMSMQLAGLNFFGLSFYIPHPWKSTRFILAIISRIFTGVFVFILPTGSQIVYLIKLMLSDNSDIQEIAGVLNLVLTELLTSIKLFDLFIRRNTLKQIIDQFSNTEFHNYSEWQKIILENAIKSSRKIYLGLLAVAHLDVIGHVILVPAINMFRTLPLKMDMIIFDVEEPKYFNCMFIFQIIYKPCMVTTCVILQTLPWSAMLFTVSQLDVLIDNIENIDKNVKLTMIENKCDENEAFRIIFRRSVQHHNAIIRFVNKLQAAFSGLFSMDLVMSACINGTTTIQFLSIESPLDNISEVLWVSVYLLIFVLNIFVDTYLGDLITTKAAFIPTAIYSCPWNKLNNNMKKNIIIYMSKAQQPLVLKAIKMIPVSMETFTRVMNWTYKAFAILNQTK